MKQNRFSVLTTRSDGDDRLHSLIDRNRLLGLATMLVGLSQLFLWPTFPDFPSRILISLVGLSGGGLLVAIGSNVLQGKETFESTGVENERMKWTITVIAVIIAIGMVVATVWIIFT